MKNSTTEDTKDTEKKQKVKLFFVFSVSSVSSVVEFQFMNVIFKVAEIAGETVLHFLRTEFQAFEPFPAPLDENANKQVLRQLLENENYGKAWLILCAGEIAGYAVLTFGFSLERAGQTALIDELYLREQFRRKGIGQLTLKFINEFCAALNIRAVQLEVEPHNAAALGLYQTSGFVNHERYFLTKLIN